MRVFVCSLLGVLVAAAQVSAEHPRMEKFRQLDRNHDGKLTRDEFSGHPGNFRAMDCDDDRLVTADEYVSPYNCEEKLARADVPPDPRSPEGRFQARDTSRDGVLSRSEWRDEELSFQSVDANRDGVVTLREYVSQPRADSYPDESFAELDHDRDGRISRDEWHGDAEGFERADRDRDGVLERGELVFPDRAFERTARFRELDRDRDGRIEWSEWDGDDEAFRLLDENGDDAVSRSEFGTTRVLSRRFSRLDYDRTGDLSRNEWPGDQSRFARLDRNRDGFVSRDEYLFHR